MKQEQQANKTMKQIITTIDVNDQRVRITTEGFGFNSFYRTHEMPELWQWHEAVAEAVGRHHAEAMGFAFPCPDPVMSTQQEPERSCSVCGRPSGGEICEDAFCAADTIPNSQCKDNEPDWLPRPEEIDALPERVNPDLQDWYTKTCSQSPWRRAPEGPAAPGLA